MYAVADRNKPFQHVFLASKSSRATDFGLLLSDFPVRSAPGGKKLAWIPKFATRGILNSCRFRSEPNLKSRFDPQNCLNYASGIGPDAMPAEGSSLKRLLEKMKARRSPAQANYPARCSTIATRAGAPSCCLQPRQGGDLFPFHKQRMLDRFFRMKQVEWLKTPARGAGGQL